MKKIKAKYKIDRYYKEWNNDIIRKSSYQDIKPEINDYANDFSPKLSRCFTISFFVLKEDGKHYKEYERWWKSKRGLGWKRVV